jgi:hypothetical protein
MKYKLMLLLAGMAVATPAYATITMVSPSSDNPGNVLCNDGGVVGTSVNCFLDTTAITFTTVGGTTQLKADGGQAEVERVDGLNLTDLVWFAPGGETFGYAEFRLFNGSGNAAFKVEDNEGEIFNFLAPITGPGRFAFLGINGESVAKVTVTVANGFKTFRQVRLGDADLAGVPEPATWAMMMLGIGLAGAAMRRKQKTAVRFAI